MNYLNQLLGIFRQFTRPIFSHLRNSLPVLLTLGLILIFVGIGPMVHLGVLLAFQMKMVGIMT